MIGRRAKILLDAGTGAIAVGLLRAVKLTKRQRAANFAGAAMRKLGPLLPEHRVGRANLRAAFPEKSDAEIEDILAGVWDNLGRVAAEFAHLDEFGVEEGGPPTVDTILFSAQSKERLQRITTSGRGVIAFAAHLANWELPALAAKRIGGHSAILYRRPNIEAISNLVTKLRTPLMGELIPTGLDAPLRLARLLQSGVHVGILADQHYTKGTPVKFFGRSCLVNPLVALLARQTAAPIYGVRVVRLADANTFSGEISDEVVPVRAADGRIDITGTMQAVTDVIEGWVRDNPDQWLWLHRRWR